MHPAAEWLSVADGQRLCLLHRPAAAARGIVVHVHAFAEEMNRTRRMSALMSRRLAECGWVVVQLDLGGCGDSSGDFADASWSGWISDLHAAVERAITEATTPLPLCFWAVRGGALLLPALLRDHPHADLLLWQPVVSGAQLLNQFLRLKIAANSIAGGDRVDGTALREQLRRDGYVEIAGYSLSAAMAEALQAARLELPDDYRGRVSWIEGANRSGEISPASSAVCARWINAGIAVSAHAVDAPPFWHAVETIEAPAFIDRSIEALHA